MPPFDFPCELTQPPDQLRLFLAVGREIRAEIAEHKQPLLLLRDILKRARRVVRVRDRNFLLPFELRAENLPQPRRTAPDEQSFFFFPVAFELRDRAHDAMETTLLRRI